MNLENKMLYLKELKAGKKYVFQWWENEKKNCFVQWDTKNAQSWSRLEIVYYSAKGTYVKYPFAPSRFELLMNLWIEVKIDNSFFEDRGDFPFDHSLE